MFTLAIAAEHVKLESILIMHESCSFQIMKDLCFTQRLFFRSQYAAAMSYIHQGSLAAIAVTFQQAASAVVSTTFPSARMLVPVLSQLLLTESTAVAW